MDLKPFVDAIPRLVQTLSIDAFEPVAEAIMTTDTRRKTASQEIKLKKGLVRVAGMTKGSGMIHPDMATTLGFVLTDAEITAQDLQGMLVAASDRSYNCLSVDGDTSTNDMVLLLANGASGVKPSEKERLAIAEVVTSVMESLAEQIAGDGEGASKRIIIRTCGFKTNAEAKLVARSVANSPLVKTAIAGNDPNWGRILAAAGYSGVSFEPADIDIRLQGIAVCRKGVAAEFNEALLKGKLEASEVSIEISSRSKAKGEARFFTCDLTEGYIQINGSYCT
jgi:glutamate N-acetyltransferase/amino-acid N-acetyltransferase